MATAVLVGCGAMSTRWLDAIAGIDGLDIVGLVDLDATRAHDLAQTYDLADIVVGSDLAAVLAETRPDMVFDVVVPAARRDVVTTALAAGCHVLTEKPFAANMEDARAILAAVRASGRCHAVMQNRRYVAGVRRLKRFLASGAIGRPVGLHADFFVGPHFGGFREEMAHVLLLDMAIHTFDVARLLAGARPTSAQCIEWNPPNSWYRSGAAALARFTFADGPSFDYRGSWCAVGQRTSWESSWRIVAEEGSVLWDGADGMTAERATGAREGLFDAVAPIEIPPLDPADRIDGHKGVIEDFLAALSAGTEPETAGTDNIWSLAMVLAAIASAETGKAVTIPADPSLLETTP